MAGRLRANDFTVPQSKLLIDNDMKMKQRNMNNMLILTLLLANNISTLQWLARRHLIANEVPCNVCQYPARL